MRRPRVHTSLAVTLAVAHVALTAAAFFWTPDESVARLKRGLPPTAGERAVDAARTVGHRLTLAVGFVTSLLPLASGARLACVTAAVLLDGLVWGVAVAWVVGQLRRAVAGQGGTS